jgi:polysaccharide export outer membrane protein
MKTFFVRSATFVVLCSSLYAQAPPQPSPAPQAAQPNGAPPAGVVLPRGYVIGPEDVLSIVFWRDKDLSGDVRVRPDGKISLPLLNDVQAAGLTPEELRARLAEAAAKFVQEPSATVVVREIHSRNVFITGNVGKPGTYPLNGEMTVLQLIAQAGGLLEYADAKNIAIIRTDNARQRHLKFNYKDVVRQKRPEQNIALQPGDTVVVP